MPETQSTDHTSTSNSHYEGGSSDTTREWIEERLSDLESRQATNNHTRAKERVVELRKLEDGWMGGDGRAPSSATLDALERALEVHLAEVRESPRVFPTLDGGFQMEWFLRRTHHITVEVHAGGESGEIGIVDLKTGRDQTLDLDTRSSCDWSRVARLIGQHS